MDEFELCDLEKETNNTFHQNAIHNKERENDLIKKSQVWNIFFCLCYNTRGTYD